VVLALPETQMAGTVAAYYSVGTEPETHGLIFALWKRGTYVLLPLLRSDGDLDWASYEGPDSLAAGPRGLLEPAEPPRGVPAITSADLIIALALLHEGELVDRVPAGEHDVPVRAAALPGEGITRFG
jgi:5-formyltetrahydrofolate cyclo-ligase